jgi:hypothetical protein
MQHRDRRLVAGHSAGGANCSAPRFNTALDSCSMRGWPAGALRREGPNASQPTSLTRLEALSRFIGTTSMSLRPKLHAFAPVGLALLQSILACTLTSDPYNPVRTDALEPTPGVGGTSSQPATPEGEPNVACSSELSSCDIELTPGSSCGSDLDCESRACVSGACASPTCNDGRENGGEAGVDCGGPCGLACGTGGCSSDADCESRNCLAGSCRPATCDDDRMNQGEAAPDCAGPCAARCALGDACGANADCEPELFCPEATRRCTSVSCRDGLLNGEELGLDCGGGTCPGCPVGTPCNAGEDCLTGVCGGGGTCLPPSCDDQVRNQNETGVDCGGACPDCATAQPCAIAGDCQSGVCGGGGCALGIDLCCQAPSCGDGVRNGNEPVTDCGDAACGSCPLGNPCTAGAQCASGSCQAGSCRVPPCADGVRNGAETDTDCGGNDPGCTRCAVGDSCAGNGDCASGSCVNRECSNCADEQRNGTETAVDCGGVCGPCDPGEACGEDADCQSGACQDERCCGGARVDCTRCARRLVGAIDCNTNGPAATPNCEAFLDCLAANPAICPVRHAPGCSEDPGGVCNHIAFGGNGGPGIGLADAILGSAQCEF